jgi:hypothetical protein
MVSHRYLSSVMFAAAVACGDANQPSTDSVALDESGESDSSASAAASGSTSEDDVSEAGGDESNATSSVETGSTSLEDSSADGTGGEPTDDRLLPLEPGRSWTYDVTTFGTTPVCSSGEHTEAVLEAVDVEGRSGFEVSSFCPAAGTSVLAVEGDVADLLYQSDWIRVLDVPVEEGHTWTSTGPIEYVWRDAGTVTVPAGTFSDCWTREQIVAYTAYTTFCRGVGAVRHVSMDLSGSGWDAVLIATDF